MVKKTVTIPAWKNFLYVEVFKITEYKEGAVFKTKRLGFAPATRTRKSGEIYTPISVPKAAIDADAKITLTLIGNGDK